MSKITLFFVVKPFPQNYNPKLHNISIYTICLNQVVIEQ